MTESANTVAIKSVPWSVKNALVVFLVPWVLLPILVLVALQILAPYSHAVASYLQALNQNKPEASFGLVVLDALGSYAVIWHYLKKNKVNWRILGFKRFNLAKALLYLALLLAFFLVLIAVVYAVVQALDPGFNADQPQTNEFTNSRSPLSLWALVIIPPFVEEPVFRGFMFPAFAKRYGLIAGAIISSILFGFAHLQANVSVYTFVLGLLLCWLYTRSGSIFPGIGLHMLNNYIAYSAITQK